MNSSSPTVWLRTTSSASLATPLEDLAMTAPRSVCSTSDVDALDDDVHIHLPEQPVQVDPVQHPLDVDLVQHGVQIDPTQQSIHIQRGNHKLDRTLRNGLGQRLYARAQPVVHRAQWRKRVHAVSIAAHTRARITP
jgi:hypothetical protein